jgi:hypothetical protein
LIRGVRKAVMQRLWWPISTVTSWRAVPSIISAS